MSSKRNQTLTTMPWRILSNWDKSADHLLRNLVETFAYDCDTPSFNILLTGLAGSGKSSLINSIQSMISRKIIMKVEAGDTASAVLTKEFHLYELRKSPKSKRLPWKIGDTSGIPCAPTTNEVEVGNILEIVDGHVPEGYKFREQRFHQNSPGYIHKPSLSNKIHCVAIVLDARSFMVTSSGLLEKLQSLRQGLKQRGIPTYAILTGIDKFCGEVHIDVTRVYHSILIRDLVSSISKKLDIPKGDILPVINYRSQIEIDNNIDILLVHALRRMTGAKQRQCLNMKREIAALVPKTKLASNLPFYNIIVLGQIGSGKSSFFNGINAIFKERLFTTMAEAGERGSSLTKEFRMYRIELLDKKKTLSTRICDTPGLIGTADVDIDVRNVLSAIDGHVPDKYEFTDKEFHQDSPGYIPSPLLKNRAHCVCIVIDAGKVHVTLDNMWRKLKCLYTAIKERGIPTRILLAKIDLLLDNDETIENIDKHEKVLHLKRNIIKKLKCDVKQDHFFAIKNYVSEVEFDADMDFLLLRAIRHMLIGAQGYLSKFGSN